MFFVVCLHRTSCTSEGPTHFSFVLKFPHNPAFFPHNVHNRLQLAFWASYLFFLKIMLEIWRYGLSMNTACTRVFTVRRKFNHHLRTADISPENNDIFISLTHAASYRFSSSIGTFIACKISCKIM